MGGVRIAADMAGRQCLQLAHHPRPEQHILRVRAERRGCVRSMVIAVCLASAVVMWGVAAIGYWRVRRMYRAADATPGWRASVHARGWWMTSGLLSGISIFAATPLLIVNSFFWAIVVFCVWFVQMVAFVWATHEFRDESEGAGP
jgi:hypothetical protein